MWNAGVRIPDHLDVSAKAGLKLLNVSMFQWFLGKVTLKEQNTALGWKKKIQKILFLKSVLMIASA